MQTQIPASYRSATAPGKTLFYLSLYVSVSVSLNEKVDGGRWRGTWNDSLVHLLFRVWDASFSLALLLLHVFLSICLTIYLICASIYLPTLSPSLPHSLQQQKGWLQSSEIMYETLPLQRKGGMRKTEHGSSVPKYNLQCLEGLAEFFFLSSR